MNADNIRLVFTIDYLAAFFIALIAIVSIISLFYMLGYAKEYKGKYSLTQLYSLSLGFALSMIGVVAAGNVFTFMFFWELMSLISYFLVIYDSEQRENIRAGFVYFIMTHLSAAFLLLAFLLLSAGHAWNMDFSIFGEPSAAFAPNWLIYSLFFAGAAIKMGLAPVHFWLPLAHPAAPSHVSAMMSGLMVKLPIYLLIRLGFQFHYLDMGFAYLLLAFGLISAMVGVCKAAVDTDIKRVLAYSTVENVGICVTTLGLALLFKVCNDDALASLALVACLYHLLNHALFKSGLFLAAGSIVASTHTRNLDSMGGLIHRLPTLAVFFLVLSLAAAGMPFFNGFIGEWLLYKLVMLAMLNHSQLVFFALPIILMLLAMVAGLAFTVFSRLYSVAFLGYERTEIKAKPISALMLAPILLLSFACLFLGVVPASLNLIWEPLISSLALPYQEANFMMGSGFSTLALIIVLLVIVSFFMRTKVSRAMPWLCGQMQVKPQMQYSAVSYSQPLVRLMKLLFSVHSTQYLAEFYLRFCNFSTKARENLHGKGLRSYLLYILLVLIGGLFYAKYF